MTAQKQGRGQLTDRIKAKSAELLGYEITQQELRLMPYLQYCMVNSQVVDPNKISSEERAIMSKWREAGHITGGASGLGMTKQFWDIICELICLGYVDLID
jgi:hypothetical protein